MRIISGRNQDKVMNELLKLQLLIDKVTDTNLYVDLTNSVSGLCDDVLDIRHGINFERSLINLFKKGGNK